MSAAGDAIQIALSRARRRVRRDVALSVVGAAATVPAALLLVSWCLGGWGPRGVGPLTAVVTAALATMALALVLRGLWLAPITESAIAAAAERSQSLAEGSLRGVLELGRTLPAGASRALFERAEAEAAGRVAERTPPALAGSLGRRVRRRRTRVTGAAATVVLLVTAVGFAAPGRARSAWAPLLHPVAHARGAGLPSLRLAPGDADVDRGGTVRIRLEAPFRARATVHWRAVGELPAHRTLPLRGGKGVTALGPVDAPVVYWASTPDGARTDSFRLRPVDPLLLTRLRFEVSYPAHTGRPPDHYEGDPPRLQVPAGAVLRVDGEASRALRSLAVTRADGERREAVVDGRAFRMEWTLDPQASGRWVWRIRGAVGRPGTVPGPIELEVTPDVAPAVSITSPGLDTLMPPGLRQPVVADASDDFGLAAAWLVYRRVGVAGAAGDEVRTAIPVGDGGPRALLRTILDATQSALLPGDAVEYRVEVADNAPRPQVGRSATHTLRLPGARALRARARSEAEELLAEAESLSRSAATLEKATRDLGRRADGEARSGRGGASPGGGGERRLGHEEAGEAAQLADEQASLLKAAAALSQRLDALRATVEQAGLDDPELRRKLAALDDLYRGATERELQAGAERLREAADALDPEAVRAALAKLAEQQRELERRLDRGADLVRRAAAEQEFNTLAREAEDLSREQSRLAAAMTDDSVGPAAVAGAAPSQPADSLTREPATAPSPSGAASDSSGADSASVSEPAETTSGLPDPVPSPPDLSGRQRGLQQRAQTLAGLLHSLQEKLLQLGDQDASGRTGSAKKKTESAQASMGRAGEASRQQQAGKAAAAGKQAAGELSQAAQTLDAARREMVESRRRAAQQTVRQATQDALALAQGQESLRRSMESAGRQGGVGGSQVEQMASRQEALQQGLEQLGRNLSESGADSPARDEQVGRALARATMDMQQTLAGLTPDRPLPTEEAGRAVEALNQLAMSLLQSDGRLQGSPGAGASQETVEALSRLAREQGALNQQVEAIARMGREARTQVLGPAADAQRGIARRVGELSGMSGGADNVLGRLGRLSSEADAVARELEQGRLDADVAQRQQRLFQHLLDAGRTLERDEYGSERQSRSAIDGPVSLPAAVDPALLDGRVRYPVPDAAELRALPPAYRRMILEYFKRLNAAGGQP